MESVWIKHRENCPSCIQDYTGKTHCIIQKCTGDYKYEECLRVENCPIFFWVKTIIEEKEKKTNGN